MLLKCTVDSDVGVVHRIGFRRMDGQCIPLVRDYHHDIVVESQPSTHGSNISGSHVTAQESIRVINPNRSEVTLECYYTNDNEMCVLWEYHHLQISHPGGKSHYFFTNNIDDPIIL